MVKKVKLDKRISRSPKGLLFLDYLSIERRKKEDKMIIEMKQI